MTTDRFFKVLIWSGLALALALFVGVPHDIAVKGFVVVNVAATVAWCSKAASVESNRPL